jgi:aquaglyceroporin related protein, other eukaryote
MLPLVLFFTVLGIGACFGMQTGAFSPACIYTGWHELIASTDITGYAINPARDLGPRLLTAMAGYGGQGTCPRRRMHGEVFT